MGVEGVTDRREGSNDSAPQQNPRPALEHAEARRGRGRGQAARALGPRLDLGAVRTHVSASIGIVEVTPGQDAHAVIAAADTAMLTT
jgi:hypothetical protein